MRYPELSHYKIMATRELQELYSEIQVWSSHLASELESRDATANFTGSSLILAMTSTSDFREPRGGSVVYSASTGKYYGWNALTSTWNAFN